MTTPWNTDWETVDPALMWDVDVFNMFVDALNERRGRFLLPNTITPFPHVTTSDIPVSAVSFPFSPSCTSWAHMQWIVDQLGGGFARKYDGNGDLIDYSQRPDILRYSGDWSFSKWLFRKWYPREINTLSDSGSIGQRARFIRRATVTPADQVVLSGLFFEHDGTQWVHRPDVTDADHIWDYGLSWGDRGAGQPAHVFGPHILNDLKTALNLCDQEFITGKWTNPKSMTTSTKTSQAYNGPGHSIDAGLLATAKSAAEAAWAAGAGNNVYGPGPAAFSYLGPVGNGNYYGASLCRSYATPQVDILPANPAMSHAAQMFLLPYDPALAGIRGSDYSATELDSHGDDVPLANMQLLQDFGIGTQTSFIGPVVGDESLSIPLPWPTTPLYGMRGYDFSGGWISSTSPYVQLFLKWNVPGGFAYTSST